MAHLGIYQVEAILGNFDDTSFEIMLEQSCTVELLGPGTRSPGIVDPIGQVG